MPSQWGFYHQLYFGKIKTLGIGYIYTMEGVECSIYTSIVCVY